MTNPATHLRNVKQLQGMINSYENKLDDRVNEVFAYVPVFG